MLGCATMNIRMTSLSFRLHQACGQWVTDMYIIFQPEICSALLQGEIRSVPQIMSHGHTLHTPPVFTPSQPTTCSASLFHAPQPRNSSAGLLLPSLLSSKVANVT